MVALTDKEPAPPAAAPRAAASPSPPALAALLEGATGAPAPAAYWNLILGSGLYATLAPGARAEHAEVLRFLAARASAPAAMRAFVERALPARSGQC